MGKSLALSLVIVVAVAVAGCAIANNEKPPSNTTGQIPTQNPDAQSGAAIPINFSAGNTYLDFRNGTSSGIFLVDSRATFGTFTEDRVDQWFWGPNDTYYEASKGDRYVGVQGSLRNDYATGYWIFVNARICDTKGNEIGTLLRSSGRPEFKMACIFLASNRTGQFGLTFKLDKRYTIDDIGGYEVVLAGEPMTIPPP